MTIEDLIGMVLVALFLLDCGLWLLYLQEARGTNQRKIMLRASLAVFVGLLTILLIDLAIADRLQGQVPDGLLVPVLAFQVAFSFFAGGTLLFAVAALIERIIGIRR